MIFPQRLSYGCDLVAGITLCTRPDADVVITLRDLETTQHGLQFRFDIFPSSSFEISQRADGFIAQRD
jgi:hypothetical protein